MLVADDQAQVVVLVATVVDALDKQPEFFAQVGDGLEFSGQELPARADLEALCIGLEHIRGIAQGVDADRVEKNVLAHPVSQQTLHLAQARGFQRTGVAA
ncbi:hypothetical protein D3C73_1433950 [compost metagenome]